MAQIETVELIGGPLDGAFGDIDDFRVGIMTPIMQTADYPATNSKGFITPARYCCQRRADGKVRHIAKFVGYCDG